MWVWFKCKQYIMGGSVKGDDLVGGYNQGRPSWGEPLIGEGFVLSTHLQGRKMTYWLHTIHTGSSVGCGSQNFGHHWHSRFTTSVRRFGAKPHFAKVCFVWKKIECKKCTLTDTVSLANTINNFVDGAAKVEQHKMQSSKSMIHLMINSNKHMTIWLTGLKTEFHREAKTI